MKFLQERDELSHKGQNGRVLVIGGSKDYVGAPALVALAALRAGIDLSVVAAPEQAAYVINSYSPDLITKKFKGECFTMAHAKEVVELSSSFDVIVIGNGLGINPKTIEFAKDICNAIPQLKVIDADAIKAFAGQGINMQVSNAVFTPHAKEFEILTGEKLPDNPEQRAAIAKPFARQNRIFLIKGNVDVILDNQNVKYNKTGNPGMTVGGTGDVLAGITAGFLAQTKDLFNSAYYAAYLNGYTGDYLLKQKGYGFTASDFIELIPVIKKKLFGV